MCIDNLDTHFFRSAVCRRWFAVRTKQYLDTVEVFELAVGNGFETFTAKAFDFGRVVNDITKTI